jgi:hypothetical protein
VGSYVPPAVTLKVLYFVYMQCPCNSQKSLTECRSVFVMISDCFLWRMNWRFMYYVYRPFYLIVCLQPMNAGRPQQMKMLFIMCRTSPHDRNIRKVIYIYKHYNINQKTKTNRTTEEEMEGPISFWWYKEQESNLILPEHDNDDDDIYIYIISYHMRFASYMAVSFITFFRFHFLLFIYGCIFCTLLFNFVN